MQFGMCHLAYLLIFAFWHQKKLCVFQISSAATPREFSNAMKKARLFLELAGINQDDINCKNKVVTNCLKFYLEERVHEELER